MLPFGSQEGQLFYGIAWGVQAKGRGSLASYDRHGHTVGDSLLRAVAEQMAVALPDSALVARFGSFAEVLGAAPERLQEIDGVGESVALDLKIVEAAAVRMTRGALRDRPVLSSWADVLAYCRAAMAFAEREEFRLLFLDKRNALIADEVQGSGTVDHTPVYPREIVRRALELNATSIVQLALPASANPVQRSEVTRYCEESALESMPVIALLVAEPKLVTVNVVGGVLVPSNTVP